MKDVLRFATADFQFLSLQFGLFAAGVIVVG
jgi:hypothetical protein